MGSLDSLDVRFGRIRRIQPGFLAHTVVTEEISKVSGSSGQHSTCRTMGRQGKSCSSERRSREKVYSRIGHGSLSRLHRHHRTKRRIGCRLNETRAIRRRSLSIVGSKIGLPTPGGRRRHHLCLPDPSSPIRDVRVYRRYAVERDHTDRPRRKWMEIMSHRRDLLRRCGIPAENLLGGRRRRD